MGRPKETKTKKHAHKSTLFIAVFLQWYTYIYIYTHTHTHTHFICLTTSRLSLHGNRRVLAQSISSSLEPVAAYRAKNAVSIISALVQLDGLAHEFPVFTSIRHRRADHLARERSTKGMRQRYAEPAPNRPQATIVGTTRHVVHANRAYRADRVATFIFPSAPVASSVLSRARDWRFKRFRVFHGVSQAKPVVAIVGTRRRRRFVRKHRFQSRFLFSSPIRLGVVVIVRRFIVDVCHFLTLSLSLSSPFLKEQKKERPYHRSLVGCVWLCPFFFDERRRLVAFACRGGLHAKLSM